MENIWTCKIGGEINSLPNGADSPLRKAVEQAFKDLTGVDNKFCFSGWSGKLTPIERAVVENRGVKLEDITIELPYPKPGYKWMQIKIDANPIDQSHVYNPPSEYL